MRAHLWLVRRSEEAIDYYFEPTHADPNRDELKLDPHRCISLYFTVTSNRLIPRYCVRLTFSPFKSELCEFIYHGYSIRASIRGESTVTVSVQARLQIVEYIEQVYESLAWTEGKYPFKFGPNEIQVVTYNQLDWPPTIELNIPKGGSGVTSGLTQVYSRSPEVIVTASMVQKSYEWAFSQGSLKSGRIPSAIQTSIWHPASLPKREEYLRAAILTEDKIASINADLRVVTSSIPKSRAWNTAVKEKELAETDISEMISLVKGAAAAEIHKPGLSSNTLTSLITGFHEHAKVMKSRQNLHHHTGRLATLIEYSLRQIHEYQEGGNKTASAAENAAMSSTRSWSNSWQKRCRKFALSCHHLFADIGWDGREIPLILLLYSKKLQDHFSCNSPAFFAELAYALKSDEYAADPEGAAAWRDLPTFLDLLKDMINGCVRDDVVHTALGYPLSSPRSKRRRRTTSQPEWTSAVKGFSDLFEFELPGSQMRHLYDQYDPSLLECPESPDFSSG